MKLVLLWPLLPALIVFPGALELARAGETLLIHGVSTDIRTANEAVGVAVGTSVLVRFVAFLLALVVVKGAAWIHDGYLRHRIGYLSVAGIFLGAGGFVAMFVVVSRSLWWLQLIAVALLLIMVIRTRPEASS